MSKVEKIIVFVLVCLCIIAMLALKAGADVAGSYGVAEFHNPIHFTRDGMVERWVLDPGRGGDITTVKDPTFGEEGGSGDFESWRTPGLLGCTERPRGFGTDCTSFGGGDVNRDTTYIYKGNTSARLDATGTFHSAVYLPRTFEANSAYQIDICYKGGDGTEDFALGVGNATLTDTYDFPNDTWTAPVSAKAYMNIGTGWTCSSAYVNVGATAKTDYLLLFAAYTSNGTYIYVDNLRVYKLDSIGVAGDHENIMSVNNASDPSWGNTPELQHKPGSGLCTDRGMWTDGVDDFVECADATCSMDPVNWESEGLFSVGCKLITNTIAAGTSGVISKWQGIGNQRSWFLRRSADDLQFYISDDGTNFDSHTVSNVFEENALYSFVSTFDPSGGSGSCINRIYYDAANIATDSTMTECTPYDSTESLQIGAIGLTETWSGDMLECSLWDGVLSVVEANKYQNPYFPATRHGDGFYVTSCDQAASHATCTLDKCREGTPNACQAEGTGAMALFGQYTELCDDNSFETFTGDDSNPNFTNWTESETAGDGTANITAYRADVIHDDVSVRLSITGTTSSALVISSCEAVTPSDVVYVDSKARKISGTAGYWIVLVEYTDGACSTGAAFRDIRAAADIGEAWDNYGGVFALAGTTNSVAVRFYNYRSASDILVDAVSLKVSPYRTPWVHNEGAGSTTYNDRPMVLMNPLSEWSNELQERMYESGFCYSSWIYSDWSNDGAFHAFYYVPTTGGTDNVHYLYKWTNNILYYEVYDSAGNTKYYAYGPVTTTTWTPGGWKYIEVCSSNTGTVKAHFYNVNNSTWYDFSGPTGTGTGIQDDQDSDFYLGHTGGNNFCDCYFSEIHIVPYSAVYPMAGWNGGRPPGWPPVNGRPY